MENLNRDDISSFARHMLIKYNIDTFITFDMLKDEWVFQFRHMSIIFIKSLSEYLIDFNTIEQEVLSYYGINNCQTEVIEDKLLNFVDLCIQYTGLEIICKKRFIDSEYIYVYFTFYGADTYAPGGYKTSWRQEFTVSEYNNMINSGVDFEHFVCSKFLEECSDLLRK